MTPTPTYLLVEQKLNYSLQRYLRHRRALPVRTIAAELSERTGVKVSKSTVALWMKDLPEMSTNKGKNYERTVSD